MEELAIVPYVLGYLSRIHNTKEQVLLIYRINTGFGNEQYSLVGGKIDPHESPMQALIRELKEELDLTINLQDLTFGTTLYFVGASKTCIALLFSVNHWEGEPSNNEPEKHGHIRWFDVDDLPPTLLPRHALLIKNLKKGIVYQDLGF